jgi:hypothetical protein
LHQSKRLDFVLLRVAPIVGPGAATGRALPVTFSRDLPAAPQNDIFLVHHAECRTKRVSFSNCRIKDRSYRAWTDLNTVVSGPDITHTCDTEQGASGAPVFDSYGRMVALHHLGFERDGPQCQSDNINKAVQMSAILDDVQKANSKLFSELTTK